MPKKTAKKDDDVRAMLRSLTVDEINALYKDHQLTYADRRDLLVAKGHSVVNDVLDENGYFKAVWIQGIDNLRHGWENFLEAGQGVDFSGSGANSAKDQLYYMGLGIVGEIQMLTSFFSAFGEVNGQKAEQLALTAGASPGLARLINITADVASGFVPVGNLFKIAGKVLKAPVGGAVKAGEEVAKTAVEVMKEESVRSALATAAKIDGAEGKFVTVLSKPATTTDILRLPYASRSDIPSVTDKSVAKLVFGEEKASEYERLQSYVNSATGHLDANKYARANARIAELENGLSEANRNLLFGIGIIEASPRGKDIVRTAEQITKRISKEDAIKELPTLKAKFGITDDSMTLSTGLGPSRTLTERQLYGHLKAIEQHADEVKNLAERALAGGDVEATEFARYITNLFTGQPTEKINYSKDFLSLLAHWDAESVARGDIFSAMRSMASDLAQLSPSNMAKFALQNQQGHTRLDTPWWGITKELYANLLLPLSTVPAAVGNTIATGLHFVERFAGAAFSANRGNAGATFTGGVYGAKGLAMAFRDAAAATGQTLMETGPAASGRFMTQRHIPGTVGHAVRMPTDSVMAMDTFFNTILFRASLYEQYAEEGMQLGIRGQALGRYITMMLNGPHTDRILRTAEHLSTTSTFQNQLGRWGEHFADLTQNSPLFFYFPFFKSYANLIKYGWDRTPGLQFISKSLYQDLAAGGARADEAIGRLTISNLMGHFFYEMYKEGMLTGSGPVDSSLKAEWSAVNQPYSIKTPQGWMSLTNLDPATHPIGMIADLAQIADQLDEMTFGQMAMAVTYSLMKNYVDTGTWHTASGIFDVVQKFSQGQTLSAQERDTLISPWLNVRTGGPLVRRLAQTGIPGLTEPDQIARETRTYIDSVNARIPGFSKTVPPRRDAYGDVVRLPQAPGTPLFGLLSPLIPKFKSEATDRVKLEGDRIKAVLPRFEDSIGGRVGPAEPGQEDATTAQEFDIVPLQPGTTPGVALTTQQRDRWQEIYKNLLRHKKFGVEGALMDNPKTKYNEMPLALQREQFSGLLSDYKATALDLLLVEDPALNEKVLRSSIQGDAQKVDPAKKAAINLKLEQQLPVIQSQSEEVFRNLMKYGFYEKEEVK